MDREDALCVDSVNLALPLAALRRVRTLLVLQVLLLVAYDAGLRVEFPLE